MFVFVPRTIPPTSLQEVIFLKFWFCHWWSRGLTEKGSTGNKIKEFIIMHMHNWDKTRLHRVHWFHCFLTSECLTSQPQSSFNLAFFVYNWGSLVLVWVSSDRRISWIRSFWPFVVQELCVQGAVMVNTQHQLVHLFLISLYLLL